MRITQKAIGARAFFSWRLYLGSGERKIYFFAIFLRRARGLEIVLTSY